MDLSYIDWPSFRSGLVVGLGAWATWTVLKSGWTTIDVDDAFDVFDDDDLNVSVTAAPSAPFTIVKTTTTTRRPRKW